MSLDYEQLPGESPPAFRAFAIYRDLGPARSLAKAYADYRGAIPRGLSSGQWGLWSRKFRWVDRATAYDAHCDAEKRKARERKLLELVERQFEFELKNQDRLEKLVEQAQAVLDKAAQTPVADVIVVKDETEESMQTLTTKKTRTKTNVKALKMSGYARLMQETNETARQAIVGVRDEKKLKAEPVETRRVTGIVYKPADDGVLTRG